MQPTRKKRYAIAVVSLLTLVFAGVATVIGMLGQTTFRPLPFTKPDRLVQVTMGGNLWEADTLAATLRMAPQVADFAMLSSSIGGEVVHGGVRHNATIVRTSPNFFDLLGLSTRRANLAAYREQRGSAIITTTLVRQLHIDGDPIGASIQLGDRSFTVGGLVDPLNAYPVGTDLWFAEPSRGPVWLGVLRTKTPADPDAIITRLNVAVRTVTGDQRQMVSGRMIGDVARPTMSAEQRALSAGIVLFAVIAVLNYGLLGIGEARRREQEFAIRVALGAGRDQVGREFILGQLALIGIASALAVALVETARVVLPFDMTLPVAGLPVIIWELLALFGCLLLIAAIIPSRIASGTGEMEVLRRVGARGSRFEQMWNRGFIATQFAVTAFLLVAGGVAALTFSEMQRTKYGFETERRLLGYVSLVSPALATDAAMQRASMAVEAAATAAFPGNGTVFHISGRSMDPGPFRFATDPPVDKASASPLAVLGPPWEAEDVTPSFFDVAGIRIVAGRGFRESDDVGGEPVMVVSEIVAKRFGGSQQALGKRMRFGEDDGDWRTIVGVAADAYPIASFAFQFQLIGRKRPWATGIVYRPYRQVVPHLTTARITDGILRGSLGGVSILVRNPAPDAAQRMRAMLTRVAPDEAFSNLGPLAAYLDWRGDLVHAQFTTRLLGQFAMVGFLLALIGAVLLIDEVVRSRTSEIGIRRALGAQSAHLVALASRETFVAGAIGVLCGTAIGARLGPVAAMWMQATPLFEQRAMTPVGLSWPLMIGVPMVLVLLIAAGTAVRALRAARLDPMVALRTS